MKGKLRLLNNCKTKRKKENGSWLLTRMMVLSVYPSQQLQEQSL
jgi:hypothetical protein